MTRRGYRHRAEALVFRLLTRVWDLLPEPAALRVGAAMGVLAGSLLRIRLRDVHRHLMWAFPGRPPAWRRRVARGSYAHLGREAVVLFSAGGLATRAGPGADERGRIRCLSSRGRGGARAHSSDRPSWELGDGGRGHRRTRDPPGRGREGDGEPPLPDRSLRCSRAARDARHRDGRGVQAGPSHARGKAGCSHSSGIRTRTEAGSSCPSSVGRPRPCEVRRSSHSGPGRPYGSPSHSAIRADSRGTRFGSSLFRSRLPGASRRTRRR